MKKRIQLDGHILVNGKFVTPMNIALGDKLCLVSWTKERLPEYVWMGLILSKYERKKGLYIIKQILNKLFELDKEINLPMFSKILNMNKENQIEFYKFILSITQQKILSPLSVLYTFTEYEIFNNFFGNSEISIKDRLTELTSVLKEGCIEQSDFSTDLRFLVVYYQIISNYLHPLKELLDDINTYPNLEHSDEEMKRIRPSIRSSEMTSNMMDEMMQGNKYLFSKDFWEKVSIMTDCELFGLKFKSENEYSLEYIDIIKSIFEYSTNLFLATTPLNKKQLVLLGIATFSFKQVQEVVEHDLYNTIISRSIIRNLIDYYILMKYLLMKEKEKPKIYELYQDYGMGAFKKVVSNSKDSSPIFSHVNYKYISILVNNYKSHFIQDMDTRNFENEKMREKAESVGEKELWKLAYEYGSSYVHGLWGAVRESSLLACKNPAHQNHCVPDYNYNSNLKSVWADCVLIMNKIICLIDEIFEIPQDKITEIKNIEKQLLKKSFDNITE